MSEHRKLTQAELCIEAQQLFGDDPLTFAFRCPNCGDVATVGEFAEAGAPARAGQECIGRLLSARGCNWVAYGLFRGPWEIVMPAEAGPPARPERSAWSFPLATGEER